MARLVNTQLSEEDMQRLEIVTRKHNVTTYGFVKDAILKAIRDEEEKTPGGQEASAKVLRLLELLKTRKWTLYQWQDFSDESHRKWLTGRDVTATKQEAKEAVALFRLQEVGKKDASIAAYKAAHKVDE